MPCQQSTLAWFLHLFGMRFSLRTKIFFSLVLLVLVGFGITGLISYSFFKQENERFNRAQVLRTRIAINGVVDFMLKREMVRYRGEELAGVMYEHICEVASLNQIDINIYDLTGKNLISSNPEPIAAGLYPDQLDGRILVDLRESKDRVIIFKDPSNPNLSFAYGLLEDAERQTVAIIGMPFLTDQVALRGELTEFLSELGLYYMLLLFVSIAVAYILTSRLVRPINQLVSEMRRIRLTRKSDRLPVSGSDEVAQLVREYNHMLGELEVSAEALARTERESAWREMSRQVAHEIKNPLTPMRLHLQNLLSSSEARNPEKITEVLTLLMEQVDSLTDIATSFSEFARMPEPKIAPFPLQKLLDSIEQLFENEGFAIENTSSVQEVLADYHQLFRALQNLIKNALQAVPEGRNPQVVLRIEDRTKELGFLIADNGSGIALDQQDRIFEPQFTTKTSGMGLGLGIVKAIAESLGGRVSLLKTSPSGSTFGLFLPLKPIETPERTTS